MLELMVLSSLTAIVPMPLQIGFHGLYSNFCFGCILVSMPLEIYFKCFTNRGLGSMSSLS